MKIADSPNSSQWSVIITEVGCSKFRAEFEIVEIQVFCSAIYFAGHYVHFE